MVEDTPRRPIRRVSSTMPFLSGKSKNWEDGKTYRAKYKKLAGCDRELALQSADPIVGCWIKQVELKEKKNTMSPEEYEERKEKLAREYSDAKDVQIDAAKDAMEQRGMGTRGLLTDGCPKPRPVLVWDKLHGWFADDWH